MIYRALGMIETGISGVDSNNREAQLNAIDGYAAECSIIKVALSESCNYVADEMVQIYGGYGYTADYPAERAYRDARINRLFEGTSEINRLLISGRLMKTAMNERRAGDPLEIATQVLSASETDFDAADELLAAESRLVRNGKQLALINLGIVGRKNKLALSDQQMIMLAIADMIIEIFAMESAILRTQKLAASQGRDAAARYLDMTQVFCGDAIHRIEFTAKNTFSAMAEGDELCALLAAVRRLTEYYPTNTIAARQRIAKVLIEANSWAY